MGYWPGELVYYSIPLFIAILSMYFFHKKQAENQKLKTLVDEMRGRVECPVCLAGGVPGVSGPTKTRYCPRVSQRSLHLH